MLTPDDNLQLVSAIGHDNGQGYLRDHKIEDVYTTRLEMVHPLKTGRVKLFDKGKSKEPPGVGCVFCNFRRLSKKFQQLSI